VRFTGAVPAAYNACLWPGQSNNSSAGFSHVGQKQRVIAADADRPCFTSVPAWSLGVDRRSRDRKTCVSRGQPSLIAGLSSFPTCCGTSTTEYAPTAVRPDTCSVGGAGGPEGQLNGAPMVYGTLDAERGLMTLPSQHDVQEHEGEDRAGLEAASLAASPSSIAAGR